MLDDNFIKYYFINPISLKSQFEKRLRLIYFTGHLSRYDISVFDFDTLGNHYKVRNPFSYKQLDYAYKNQTISTIDNYFKFLNNGADLKGYLAKFQVKTGKQKLGYIFIQLQPKLIQEDNRFDDLLIEGFKQTKKRKIDYSYAIYHDKNLVSQSGNFPYRVTSTWPTPDNQYLFTTQDKYNHLLFADQDQMLVVVSKPADMLYAPLGLFSLEFTFFTLLLIILLAIYATFNWRKLKKFTFYNTIIFTKIRTLVNRILLVKDPDVVLIRTRIQVSIVLIVFITLGVTAYFTISFISNQYNDKQSEKLMKKIHNVVNTIESENLSNLNTVNKNDAEAFINQIADFYETDITIFNLSGEMVTSTTNKIYEDGVVSHLMNANAYFHLNFLRESQFSQNEMIANFSYIGAYVPIFKNEKEVIGYIQLPYFNKQSDLLNEISSIIVGFINLYTALFIVIGFMAYLISTSISYPLILIQNQLKKTVLGKNEPIKWKRKDEIGDFVEQYNLMIDKLAQSAHVLAQNEREGAWRDIAKQIAHEIKNPLTPMKLSVQHLERTWNDKSPKLEDTFKRVTKTLITQIDTLSDLASEFSSYAKMPDPIIEKLLLYNSLKSITDLYTGTDEAKITLQCDEDLYVSFDESYLNRVVTNLVKNAIQAVNDNDIPEVDVIVTTLNDNNIVIQVKDNGTGIPIEKMDSIFTPYFSTKINGMVLGLPIVKNMVDSCGGEIWFENNVDVGASFFVKMKRVDV
ncbi:MAG: ATP-binding protein [Bacteroidetes bacterium]|nr:ATP-binding protein [Bacteroidota bacterium]